MESGRDNALPDEPIGHGQPDPTWWPAAEPLGPVEPPRKPRGRGRMLAGLSAGAAVVVAVGVVLATTNPSFTIKVSDAGSTTTTSPSPVPTVPSLPTSPPDPAAPPAPTAAPAVVKLPDSFAGFDRMTGAAAKREVNKIRSEMEQGSGGHSGAVDKTRIGIYSANGGADRLAFMGFSAADDPVLAAQLASSPSDAIDQFFLSSGNSKTTDYPAGSRGGVLRCGKLSQVKGVSICAAADQSSLVTLEGNQSPADLARLTLSARAAAVTGGGTGAPSAPADAA